MEALTRMATDLLVKPPMTKSNEEINEDYCHLISQTEQEVVEPSDKDFKPTTKLFTTSTTNPQPIKYAPVRTPIKGDFNLYCIDLKWLDNPGANFNSVSNDCHGTARIYKNLSNGYVKFNPIPKYVPVNYRHTASNVAPAEREAKNIVNVNKPNNNYSIYAIYNNGALRASHGAGQTAHLMGTLLRDTLHEVGHCAPFKLGHSGRYDANGKLLPYSDGTSFMGKFSSTDLTASQLYFLGWLPQNKVAEHDIVFPPMEYNIQKLTSPNTGDALKAVLIPRSTVDRPLFLSMPKFKNGFFFALHLSTGGGSQRVNVFGQHAEYYDLTFDKVAENDEYSTIRIAPKPSLKK